MNQVREANLYAKYHAKRDNKGVIVRVNQKEVNGKLTDGDLVKGEFMQIRAIPKRLVKTLTDDVNHPFVYVKVSKEEAEKIREANSPENKKNLQDKQVNEKELLVKKVKDSEKEIKTLKAKQKELEKQLIENKKVKEPKKPDTQ